MFHFFICMRTQRILKGTQAKTWRIRQVAPCLEALSASDFNRKLTAAFEATYFKERIYPAP